MEDIPIPSFNDIPLSALFIILAVLVVCSAFFSSSETAMIALNRYRLKHLVKKGKRSAIISQRLLERPDRLIGLILLGNNLVNFIAASVSTLIGMRLLGDTGVLLSPIVLVVVFLIFAEVMPKTLAAISPEKIAFPASFVLNILMKIAYPVVWCVNQISNQLLQLLGHQLNTKDNISLSREELYTVVHEAGHMIPKKHQRMLLNILELERFTVDDIMVPRNEVNMINLDKPVDQIKMQLYTSKYTRFPICQGDIDNIIGILHVRRIPKILKHSDDELFIEHLKKNLHESYFIPKGTPLHKQLAHFQQNKSHFGIVVNEYGVMQGIVTLADLLEEIVGEFTTNLQTFQNNIQLQGDGSYLINGTTHLREINRQLAWHLPTNGPKTLNGLILEYLEQIPEAEMSLKIDEYLIEILQTSGNAIKLSRIKKCPLSQSET